MGIFLPVVLFPPGFEKYSPPRTRKPPLWGERRLRRFAGEGERAKREARSLKRRNDYALGLDLTDSAALNDCSTSLNIEAVSDVTAS